MLIGKDWKIEADSLNVTLLKRHITKAKIEIWGIEGYFSTVKNALMELVDLGVRDTKLTDLKIIVKKQDELYRLIEKIQGG